MALFSNKNKKETTRTVAAVQTNAPHNAWVLRNPRITEKATDVSGKGVYVFDVASGANKSQIIRAVSDIYHVTPVKVNIVKTGGKTVRNPRTGIVGTTSDTKKAYVFLKKGETISIM
jgi:large subunit ribosomal protein L23